MEKNPINWTLSAQLLGFLAASYVALALVALGVTQFLKLVGLYGS